MVIGVTGGVGSGKTTFVQELVRLGAVVVDADGLARSLVEENPGISNALRKEFGPEMFDANGALKRRELANWVFSDLNRYQALNRILWPPLLRRIQNSLSTTREQYPRSLVVLDMAVLFESGADALTDKTVVICATQNARIAWASQKRGWSRKEILLRMKNQMGDAEKCARVDVVIQNDKSVQALKRKARNLFRQLTLK